METAESTQTPQWRVVIVKIAIILAWNISSVVDPFSAKPAVYLSSILPLQTYYTEDQYSAPSQSIGTILTPLLKLVSAENVIVAYLSISIRSSPSHSNLYNARTFSCMRKPTILHHIRSRRRYSHRPRVPFHRWERCARELTYPSCTLLSHPTLQSRPNTQAPRIWPWN